MTVTIEGVVFNVEACSAMTKKQFVSDMIAVHWQDRNEADRKKLAGDAYSVIVKMKSAETTEA